MGTSRARWAAVVQRTVPAKKRKNEQLRPVLQVIYGLKKKLLTEQMSAKHKSHHLHKEKYVQQSLYRQVGANDKARIKQT